MHLRQTQFREHRGGGGVEALCAPLDARDLTEVDQDNWIVLPWEAA